MELGVVTDVPALAGRVGAAAEAERALLTYCDDATGERVVLPASALGGWASRTAGLLHEGCGLGIGDRVAVLLPPHWQTAAVLLGAWSAGLAVSFRLWATAGLSMEGPGEQEPLDAVFVARGRLDSWLEDVPDARHRFVLGLGASGRGTSPAAGVLDDVPAGYRDYMAEVSRYADSLPAYAPIGLRDAASVDGTTFREWGSIAYDVAQAMDLRPGDRLLIDVAKHEHPFMWLLAPLAVGASVVLCANLDPATVDARAAAEGVTRVL